MAKRLQSTPLQSSAMPTSPEWKIPPATWINSLKSTISTNWNSPLFRERILQKIQEGELKMAEGETTSSKSQVKQIAKDELSGNQLSKKLAALSCVSGTDSMPVFISEDTFRKSKTSSSARSFKPESLKQAINNVLYALSKPNLDEPWRLLTLPSAFTSRPWNIEFEEFAFFDKEKSDYSDSLELIQSLNDRTRMIICTNTGEHLRDMIDHVLASPQIYELVIRPISPSSQLAIALPDWFFTALSVNLMIVYYKLKLSNNQLKAQDANGRNLKVYVAPFEFIGPFCGSAYCTPEMEFAKVQGVVYGTDWSFDRRTEADRNPTLHPRRSQTIRSAFDGSSGPLKSSARPTVNDSALAIDVAHFQNQSFDWVRYAWLESFEGDSISQDNEDQVWSLGGFISELVSKDQTLAKWLKSIEN